MIGLLVLAIMAWNFYIGYRRGLFMQAYYVVSVIIAMCVAAYFYRSLGEAINLWVPYTNPTKDASIAFFKDQNIFSLDRVYYAGVAYFAIYCIAYYGLRFLGIFFHFVRIERLDQRHYQVVGGGLGHLSESCAFDYVGEYSCDCSYEQHSNALVIELGFTYLD